eukprot:scaffold80544_cov61-Phaeocystis_antarctica.AAC.7
MQSRGPSCLSSARSARSLSLAARGATSGRAPSLCALCPLPREAGRADRAAHAADAALTVDDRSVESEVKPPLELVQRHVRKERARALAGVGPLDEAGLHGIPMPAHVHERRGADRGVYGVVVAAVRSAVVQHGVASASIRVDTNHPP